MKLTISQTALAAVLAKGAAVAPKNSPVAVLNHALLVAAGGFLEVNSTDLDRYASAATDADVITPGKTTVNAVALSALVNRHPKGAEITMETDGAALVVKCGRSRVRLATQPADAFTTWANTKPAATFTMSGEALAKAFGRVRGAIHDLSAFATLCGVYVATLEDGRLHFAATNRSVVAWLAMDKPQDASGEFSMIVPPEAIDAATRLFKAEDAVRVEVNRNMVSFSAGAARLTSKLIEGEFIDFRYAFKLETDTTITFDRAEFAACMERAVLSVDPEGINSGLTAIPREDGLEIRARNSKGGDGEERLEVEMTDGFAPFGFNPAYLGIFLNGTEGDRVTVEQIDPNARYVMRSDEDPGFRVCFAPLRINAAMAA